MPNHELEDKLKPLIRQCLQGEREVFGEIYDLTLPQVKKTLYFLLKNNQDVEDIVHDIYIEVYKSLPTFDLSRAFLPWITGVSINLVSTYQRKHVFSLKLFERIIEKTQPEIEPDFSIEVIERLNHSDLLALVMELPYKYKAILLLKYIYEYSQEEISYILQIPIGTVKSRLNYSLLQARKKAIRPGFSYTGKE